jgi:uncharacterized membrane-anchored protein
MSIVNTSLNHLLRVPLAAEVHSRPSLRLEAPDSLTHLAVYARGGAAELQDAGALQHELLTSLCQHFGVAGPHLDAKYFFHDFGNFRLQWEAHTEFATYTFAARQQAGLALEQAFALVPLRHIPQKWLQGLSGMVMVAAHVVLQHGSADQGVEQAVAEMRGVFGGNVLVGSAALEAARLWTDFAIRPDGFSRFVVQDLGLHFQQAGRLVQRILEIETYRMMALLGLPHAQQAAPALANIEGELARLSAGMTDTTDAISPDACDDERDLLHKITALAARMEKLALENSYRFAASKAYFRLVQARIEELREERIDGVPTVGEFMDRRLAPAMSTCESMVRRQQALAERIGRSNDLLRTRVGIVQEQQNRRILESLNTRAAQQLRLQQAVEGLSVVAISYYSVGLVNYAGKALKAAGWPVNPDVATGALIPVLVLAVWFGLRRMHRRVAER